MLGRITLEQFDNRFSRSITPEELSLLTGCRELPSGYLQIGAVAIASFELLAWTVNDR